MNQTTTSPHYNRTTRVRFYRQLYWCENTMFGIFAVTYLEPVHFSKSAVVKGTFPVYPNFDLEYEITGHVEMDPKYKNSYAFIMSCIENVIPTDKEGMFNLLSSGAIKGIGPTLAKSIVDTFGDETGYIFEHDLNRLIEVNGIGKKKLETIKEGWKQTNGIRDLIIFLRQYDVSSDLAGKLYATYKDKAIETISTNPYKICEDITGFGFVRTDQIAQKMGISGTDDLRVESAIMSILHDSYMSGNVWFEHEEVVNKAVDLLCYKNELNRDEVVACTESILQRMCLGGKVYLPGNRIYDAKLYKHEDKSAARLLAKLYTNIKPIDPKNIEAGIRKSEEKGNFQYAPEQRAAIQTSLTTPVSIITGGPGTGKSTITKCIIDIIEKSGQKAVLCAPTGRAAKRMAEITGREAKTIHRLLESGPDGRFAKDESNQIEGDVLIIDETSMVDISLLYYLLAAVPEQMRVIFIGDADQLPSVGPGRVLGDMIDSNVLPVSRLKLVFRQGAQSPIITSAHNINNGKRLDARIWDGKDIEAARGAEMLFIPVGKNGINKALLESTVVKLYTELLPKIYNVTSDDIQILSPQHDRLGGVTNLNNQIQQHYALLNGHLDAPARPSLSEKQVHIMSDSREFFVGDKVIQIRNNYEKNVMNGDIGKIVEMDQIDHSLTVELTDGSLVSYETNNLSQLALAYSITVHKAQGSEYPIVILPLTNDCSFMLQRRLFYTAVTRARKVCVLIGEQDAIDKAIKSTFNRFDRNTSLDEFLTKGANA